MSAALPSEAPMWREARQAPQTVTRQVQNQDLIADVLRAILRYAPRFVITLARGEPPELGESHPHPPTFEGVKRSLEAA